jgi:hypothetical protein
MGCLYQAFQAYKDLLETLVCPVLMEMLHLMGKKVGVVMIVAFVHQPRMDHEVIKELLGLQVFLDWVDFQDHQVLPDLKVVLVNLVYLEHLEIMVPLVVMVLRAFKDLKETKVMS